MGRFTKYLLNLAPRTGRIIVEDGGFINEADLMALKAIEEVSTQSLLGNAYAASWKGDISQGGSVDLVLEIPAGINLYLHARQQTIIGSQVIIALRMNPTTGYTVAETFKGFNLDETLGGIQSQASIIRTGAPTSGSVFRREDILVAPGSGNNKTTATTSSADAVPKYNQGNRPLLRIQNTGNATSTVIVSLIWAEITIPV